MFSLVTNFPKLALPPAKTSDQTPLYNCIGWAFEDSLRKWWPNKRGYHWPIDATGMTDLDAFNALLAERGWQPTDNRGLQFGVKKLALYAVGRKPKHMARQLP